MTTTAESGIIKERREEDMRPVGNASSPAVKQISKALQVYVENDEQYHFYGYELYGLLEGRMLNRFRLLVTGYEDAKRSVEG